MPFAWGNCRPCSSSHRAASASSSPSSGQRWQDEVAVDAENQQRFTTRNSHRCMPCMNSVRECVGCCCLFCCFVLFVLFVVFVFCVFFFFVLFVFGLFVFVFVFGFLGL